MKFVMCFWLLLGFWVDEGRPNARLSSGCWQRVMLSHPGVGESVSGNMVQGWPGTGTARRELGRQATH